MPQFVHILFAILLGAVPATAQVLHFADLNTRDLARLDKAKTLVIVQERFWENTDRICLREPTASSTSVCE